MATPAKLKIQVQIGVTTILLIFCIYIIATEPASSDKLKWAFGIVGIVIGYWLLVEVGLSIIKCVKNVK